jgi:hypothetical protein
MQLCVGVWVCMCGIVWHRRAEVSSILLSHWLALGIRVGQNHIYTVYIRYFWQGNHQIYGYIRCIYTVLANPTWDS